MIVASKPCLTGYAVQILKGQLPLLFAYTQLSLKGIVELEEGNIYLVHTWVRNLSLWKGPLTFSQTLLIIARGVGIDHAGQATP